jgi:hypothetical protein
MSRNLENLKVWREEYDFRNRDKHSATRRAKRQEDPAKYNEYMRDYRDRNRETLKKYDKEYRNKNRARILYSQARTRAGKKGIEFTIDVTDIVIPERCPVFGVRLGAGVNGPVDYSPTIDRVDPRKGYVKGNVWVISAKANRCKNNATVEELQQLVAALMARLA